MCTGTCRTPGRWVPDAGLVRVSGLQLLPPVPQFALCSIQRRPIEGQAGEVHGLGGRERLPHGRRRGPLGATSPRLLGAWRTAMFCAWRSLSPVSHANNKCR